MAESYAMMVIQIENFNIDSLLENLGLNTFVNNNNFVLCMQQQTPRDA